MSVTPTDVPDVAADCVAERFRSIWPGTLVCSVRAKPGRTVTGAIFIHVRVAKGDYAMEPVGRD